ncbi:hypothetical protein Ga0451573_001229 [Peptococcaceae bacterium DYL19]|nr:hypothetical protein [Phosphitispora fastidiosa]
MKQRYTPMKRVEIDGEARKALLDLVDLEDTNDVQTFVFVSCDRLEGKSSPCYVRKGDRYFTIDRLYLIGLARHS